MERVDDYKDKYPSFGTVEQVKNGQPYRVDAGWMVTSKPKVPPYYRPAQKRRAEKIIEKALQEE